MNQDLIMGLQVSAIGLAGVFSVLILFFIITKLMVNIANKMQKDKKD
ncbi:MAG: OadG family protein [Clostridiaceae bacterium]|nr:OadG family protein [Clostridiaceae bacterium]